MHNSTSGKRKNIGLYAVASTALLALATVSALLVGVTPATAANLASQPDTQIAMFMVPLTILVLAVLFEVTRFALRGNLPAEAPAPRRIAHHWSPSQRYT
ncbi:hypothetical protein [Devosia sp. A369]